MVAIVQTTIYCLVLMKQNSKEQTHVWEAVLSTRTYIKSNID